MKDRVTLTLSRRFSASAERVFDAWLDPGIARRWLFATDGGEIVQCEIDARVGGRFYIVDRRPAGDAEHGGEYIEIDRPRRLVFTFGAARKSDNEAVVEIEITPLGDGGCELVLTQNMPPEFAPYRDRTESGWRTLLGHLARQTEPRISSASS